ncbi:MAG TPA: mechanosensitive ion channel family protein [Actinomycetota bacterium]|jgi:small-conductance mechanosensitive channel
MPVLSHAPTTSQIVQAAVIVAGCVVGGLAARSAVRSVMARRGGGREPSRGLWVLVGALDNAVLEWAVAAGVYAALLALPLSARVDEALGKLVLAIAILTGTFAAARAAGGFARMHGVRHEAVLGSSSIFANVARLLVFVLGGLVVLQTMGVSIAPLLTALGVGGLAVALALQDTLSNLFAGLHVLASKKVVPGDYVRLDSGEEGYVIDINWRNTALRHIRNNVILVPNARLASAVVTNFYKPFPEMSVIVGVRVGLGSNLAEVERVTVEVARETLAEVEGAVKDFEPIMRFRRFGESSVDFNVILRVSEPTAEYLVTHEFVKRVHERFAREGIEIPFPVRTIVSRDGSSSGLAPELGRGSGQEPAEAVGAGAASRA